MKFDNYVYLTICEESLKLFKKSYFSTYKNYCNTFYTSMNEGVLSSRENGDLLKMLDVLDLIYGFDDNQGFKYIMDFFGSDKKEDFERYVTQMSSLFPFAFN